LSNRFSLTHKNLSKLVNLLTSILFFHSLYIVLLGLLLLSPVALLSPFVIKLQVRLYCSISCSGCVVYRLNYLTLLVAHHVTSSPTINSPVSNISTSFFLKRFTFVFLLSLYSPTGYLRTDTSGCDNECSFRYLSPHFIQAIFFKFYLTYINKCL